MKMTYITTTCPYCGTGCGLNLIVTDAGVAGVAPLQRSPVGRGKLCMRGLNCVKASAENPAVPMINGESVDFEKAVAQAADLKKYSGEDLAVITSRRLSNEAQSGISALAKSLNAGIVGTFADGENDFADIKVKDIAKAQAVLVVGDCMRKLPLTGNQLFAVQEKGGRIFFAGEECYTAIQADEKVFAKDGTLEIPDSFLDALKSAENALVLYCVCDKFAAAAKEAAAKAGVKAVPVYDTSNGRGAAKAGFEPVLAKLSEKMPKAMLLFAETPLLDDDMYKAFAEKLEAVEFLVVVSSNECCLTDIANVVIPAGAFDTCDGTFTNWEGRIQMARKAADGKNIYDVISALSGGSVVCEQPDAAAQ